MKNTRFSFLRSRLLTATALVAFATVFVGCNNDDDDGGATPEKTIADLVIEGADFSLLEAAVTKAGLTDALKQPNLTVFAPNNAAFQASGLTEAAVTALTADQARAIIQYHVLSSTINSSSIQTVTNQKTQTNLSMNNTPTVVYLTKNTNGVFVNGAKVTTADQAASNGVIHVIDRVLMPPVGDGTLVGVVGGNPNLSILNAAALRVAAANPALAAALTGQNAFTIFAPTNAAFTAAGFTQAAVAAAPVETLTALLSNHIVTGLAFSNDLMNGNVNALSQKPLTVAVSGTGVTVKSAGIPAAANVTGANYAASNGVVHVIDKVLVP